MQIQGWLHPINPSIFVVPFTAFLFPQLLSYFFSPSGCGHSTGFLISLSAPGVPCSSHPWRPPSAAGGLCGIQVSLALHLCWELFVSSQMEQDKLPGLTATPALGFLASFCVSFQHTRCSVHPELLTAVQHSVPFPPPSSLVLFRSPFSSPFRPGECLLSDSTTSRPSQALKQLLMVSLSALSFLTPTSVTSCVRPDFNYLFTLTIS